jgi:hypothetical protein
MKRTVFANVNATLCTELSLFELAKGLLTENTAFTLQFIYVILVKVIG